MSEIRRIKVYFFAESIVSEIMYCPKYRIWGLFTLSLIDSCSIKHRKPIFYRLWVLYYGCFHIEMSNAYIDIRWVVLNWHYWKIDRNRADSYPSQCRQLCLLDQCPHAVSSFMFSPRLHSLNRVAKKWKPIRCYRYVFILFI